MLYEDQIQLVDPITRETHPAAKLQNCTDRIKNLFQFDIDQEALRFTLTLVILHQDRPSVLGPTHVSAEELHSFPGPQHARMHTRSKLSSFWDEVLVSASTRNALKKFSQKPIVFSNNNKDSGSFLSYAAQTDIFVDIMIFPGYFKDRFMDMFGPIAFVLEQQCVIFFFAFFFNP